MAGYDRDFYEFAPIRSDGVPFPNARGFKLPRVTGILDVLNKPLTWWAYKLGVEATMDLASQGKVEARTVEQVYEELKKLGRQGLAVTPMSSSKGAAGRGGDIHDIAELFFTEGVIPPPEDVPVEYHGYVKALAKWWVPKKDAKIIASETMLYSLKHGYAGTVDLIYAHDGTYYVADFKTSKGIYESALLQIAAYVEAATERGYVPEGAKVVGEVVRLGADGEPEVKTTPCRIEDFLAIKQAFDAVQKLKGDTYNGSKSGFKPAANPA